MINNRHREKLLNALVYFTSNVNHAGKTKLFKLLYSMDFLHFEKTGRSVTGLKYFAWEKGPVPVELYDEWKSPARDFNEALTRTTKKISEEMEKQIQNNLKLIGRQILNSTLKEIKIKILNEF